MRARIIGTGYSLPAFRADNDYLATLVDTSDEWISERTGIRARHLAKEETTLSMSAEAARMALEKANFRAEDVELLIVATITGDMDTPSTACQVQKEIGAKHALAFDINAACSGFLYGLHVAEAFIESGTYRNALLIGAETLSKIVDWTDRGTCVLFGDGAGAALVTASESGGLLSQSLGSSGEKWDVLFCEGRPNENPLRAKDQKCGYLKMNGQEVFKFAVRTVPHCIEDALAKAGLKPEEIDLFILHQANKRIIQAVAKRLGMAEEEFPMNMDECGNTSAASLPILLAQLDESGKLHPGDRIVLSGFGAGLTWGACVLEW